MTICLITGANRGLGLALVQIALEYGDTVYAGVRNPDKAEKLYVLQQDYGARLQILTLDITQPSHREAARDAIASSHGHLDVLIHNAGVNSKSQNMGDGSAHVSFGALTEEALLSTTKINAIAPLLLTQDLTPLLEKSDSAIVVAISSWFASLEGNQDRDFNYSYSGSKTLLNLYFRLASNALKKKGAIAFMVNPGWMQTDMGGANASLTPQASAEAIYALVQQADLEMAGQFLDWNGEIHPW